MEYDKGINYHLPFLICIVTVSYTHLDVYKRQVCVCVCVSVYDCVQARLNNLYVFTNIRIFIMNLNNNMITPFHVNKVSLFKSFNLIEF